MLKFKGFSHDRGAMEGYARVIDTDTDQGCSFRLKDALKWASTHHDDVVDLEIYLKQDNHSWRLTHEGVIP
jgi:hypothetical protein